MAAATSGCRHRLLTSKISSIYSKTLLPSLSTTATVSFTTFSSAVPSSRNIKNIHDQHKITNILQQYNRQLHASQSDYDRIMNVGAYDSSPITTDHLQHDDLVDNYLDEKEWVGSSPAAAIMSSSTEDSDVGNFDQDYDEYYLHMSPLEATKQDFENIYDLDQLRHDDVYDVREARNVMWDKFESGQQQMEDLKDEDISYYPIPEGDYDDFDDEDF